VKRSECCRSMRFGGNQSQGVARRSQRRMRPAFIALCSNTHGAAASYERGMQRRSLLCMKSRFAMHESCEARSEVRETMPHMQQVSTMRTKRNNKRAARENCARLTKKLSADRIFFRDRVAPILRWRIQVTIAVSEMNIWAKRPAEEYRYSSLLKYHCCEPRPYARTSEFPSKIRLMQITGRSCQSAPGFCYE